MYADAARPVRFLLPPPNRGVRLARGVCPRVVEVLFVRPVPATATGRPRLQRNVGNRRFSGRRGASKQYKFPGLEIVSFPVPVEHPNDTSFPASKSQFF